MTKQEFIGELRAQLAPLPPKDIEERLVFYSEMIDDRIEDGLSEEDAVSQIGSVDGIASQILADAGTQKAEGEEKPQKKARFY